jgi:hypothetical protein
LNAADALAQLEATLGPVEQWSAEQRAQINALRDALGAARLPIDHQDMAAAFGRFMRELAPALDPDLPVGIHTSTADTDVQLVLTPKASAVDADVLATRLGLEHERATDINDSRHHSWSGERAGYTVTLSWVETVETPMPTVAEFLAEARAELLANSTPVEDDLADDFAALGGVAGLRSDLGLIDDPEGETESLADGSPLHAVIDDPTHRFNDHRQPDGRWCLWSHVGVVAGPPDRRCPIDCPTSSVVPAGDQP